MAKLILSSGGSVLNQYFIDKERLSIGREDCDIAIDDPAVSRTHAAIITIGNDQIVQDLQSVNGTFVNGARISRQVLQHGDVIEFGAFNLRYLNPRAPVGGNLDQTMLITLLPEQVRQFRDDSGSGAGPAEAVSPSAHAAKVRPPSARVKLIAGSRAGNVVELNRVVAIFGKPGEQLAVITRRPHGYFITHVEGKRHARVNSQPIGDEPRALRNRDVIEVADDRLEFLLT